MPDILRNHGGRVLVSGLVVVNVVLIGMLVIREHDLAASSTTLPGLSGSESSTSATSLPEPRPEPSSNSPEPDASTGDSTHDGRTVVRRRVLAADSDQVAWRAEPGGCDTPATVEVTTDGGDSWKVTDPGIRSIVRLKAFGTDAVFAIGADADCRTTYAWIEGPDERWQHDASQTSDKWFRVPSDPNRIHDATGKTSTPCGDGVSDLAGIGSYQASVLCNDGRIRTRHRGTGWRTIRRNSDAVALNADDSEFVAALKDPSCAGGLAIRTFDVDGTGLSGGSGSCRKARTRASDKIAVSNIYTQVWLWSGKKVSVGG